MWKESISWLKERSQHTSIGLFFLWGVLMSVLSGGMSTFWAIPIMLLTQTVSILGIYFGTLKDHSGKRGILGIILNVVAMIYNLSIDFLYFLF